jgi:putative ABC transport system permease protein
LSIIVEHIRQGISSLKSHRLRAVITASIIAIGITALVGILTSIDAMGNAITKTMTRFGARSFTITNNISVSQYGRRNSYEDLSYAQSTQFRDLFDNPATVSFAINAGFNSRLRFNSAETNPNIRVLGVDENYLTVSSFELSGGRNFTPEDIHLGMPWVILGSDVLVQLFGVDATPGASIGKEVSIDGIPFRVIGELAKKGSSFGMSGGDRQVFIGIQKARQVFTKAQNNVTITVLSPKVDDLDADMIQATNVLRRVRRLRPSDPSNFTMTRSDALANDVKQQLSMVSGVGVLIGIITLLGAAVSLMNIMLVSVTERTKEIGLRKSLGATSVGIRNQFLIEALVICQIGGIAGIILGIGLGNAVGFFLGSGFIAPWFWIFVALIVSLLVGLVAGIYPANKAAKLNPIEALRHDG